MVVTANINRIDLMLVQLHLRFRLRANLYMYLFFLAVILISLFPSLDKIGWTTYIILSVLASSAAFFFVYAVGILFQQVLVSEKQGMIGAHSFETSMEGFLEKTQGTTTFTEWAGVSRMIRLKNYLYIIISMYRVHVIPRRAFASDNDFDSFAEEVQKNVDAA